MQCPFLRKKNVKFCGLNRRTMIPLGDANLATERCAGSQYRQCPLLQECLADLPSNPPCPYLSVADVHYCEVAPVHKLIPCNRTANSCCTSDSYRYCRLYLSVADPHPAGPAAEDAPAEDDPTDAPARTAPIPMRPDLAYAPNHLWLDRGDGGACHLGVDAFFTDTVGSIDAVSFPYHRDESRPVVRFTIHGVDIDLAFPNTLQCNEINTHLVVDPDEVLDDPYGRGWLFAGFAPSASASGATDPLERGLRRGEAARRWMDRESERLTWFVHEHLAGSSRLMQDGGHCTGQLSELLDRGTIHRLHAAFFTWPERRVRA